MSDLLRFWPDMKREHGYSLDIFYVDENFV